MLLWFRALLAYGSGILWRHPTAAKGDLLALVLFWIAAVPRRGKSLRPALRWSVLLLPALGLGLLGPGEGETPALGSGTAIVEGWIASPPTQRPWGDSAWLRVERLRGEGERAWRNARHAPLLRVYAPVALPSYGARCRLVGTLRAGRGPRNFDGFDERGVLAAHDAAAVLVAQQLQPLPERRGAAWRRDIMEPLRQVLAERMARTLAPSEASLLQALVLGMDDSIEPDLHAMWRGLGLAHVLAVSGMHVGLVASAILALVGPPRRPRALALLLGGVGFYAVLGGLAPSVLRASLMTAWAAMALFLGRPLSSMVSLVLASATLLLGAPHLRFDLGFQLSCAATLGIVVWAPALHGVVRRVQGIPGAGRPLAFALGSVGISVAAQLATLPLVLWKFGYLSRVALLSNLGIVPLANGALVLGLAGSLWALVEPSLCRAFWMLAGALLHGAILAGQGISGFGEPRWFLPTRAEVLLPATLASGAALGAGILASQKRRRACASCLLLVLACCVGIGVALHTRRPPRWRLEALDVGQGDALLLQVGRNAWLIDAGNERPRDQGAHVVLPHVRRAGIARLRGVILTHPHDDHMGGALTVLRGIAVDTLYLAAVSREAEAYAPLLASGVPCRWLRRGDRLTLGPGYEAVVLWPQAADSLRSGGNGQSLVLWARGDGNPHWLAMGDLEADGEAALLRHAAPALRGAAPEFLVLKAGHHGSRTSSTPEFLDVIGADVALVCVGAHNRYDHPAPSTLRAFAARQCRVLRTDAGGAIRLERRGETLWLERPGTAPSLLLRLPLGARDGPAAASQPD